MSRKFRIIPDDMLTSILTRADEANNMVYTKNRMDSILKDEKLDKARKNAFYNQELHRYLKQRKEFMDKPLRVEVANNLPYPNLTPPATQSFTPPASPTGSHPPPKFDPSFFGSPKYEETPQSKKKSSKGDAKKSSWNASKTPSKSAPSKEASESKTFSSGTPLSSLRAPEIKSEPKPLSDSAKITALKHLVYSNRPRFGVDNVGRILNGGIQVRGSDFERSIEHIVKKEKNPSPATEMLRKRLYQDQDSRKILLGIPTKQSGKGFVSIKKSKIVKYKKRVFSKPVKNCVFNPAIWKY